MTSEERLRSSKSPSGHRAVRPGPQSSEIQAQPMVLARAVQKARVLPPLLTPGEVLQLQRTIGNRGVGKLLAGVQRAPEEEVQTKPLAASITRFGPMPSTIQARAWWSTRSLGQKPGDRSTDWNLGLGNLRVNHRHIIFDGNQDLPTGTHDNIGFHSGNPRSNVRGPGELFSENVNNLGYTRRGDISSTPAEDLRLVQAIRQNDPPGAYNLITHNCQDWVDQVIRDYQRPP